MKLWRGWQVFLLSFLFFGPLDSKAQGIYFENWSNGEVTLYIDSARTSTDPNNWSSENFSHEQILQPGEFIHLDGNVVYDQTTDVYDYSWYVVPSTTTYNGGAGGYVGSADLIAHYAAHGTIARVSATRGDEELAVGRAVITNSSQNTYQFQGQSIMPGETVAFLSPANVAMWNSIWEEVTRFSTLVTQPNYLQWDAAGNWRGLDWQEKMMWWGGPADPIQWAWYEWDGQTFNHQGNEIDGTIPSGSGVAAPPVNPVNPNWPQVMTGNNTPPTTFTPAGGTSTPGGGGTGGGGGATGGGGGATGGGGVGTGTINNGTIWIQFPDDYAREPTLQVATNLLSTIDEDTAKIRQHTWGANQRLDEIKDILEGSGPVDLANVAVVENQFKVDVNAVEPDFEDAAGANFFDLILNNLPADGQGAVVINGLGFNNLEISPREEPWGSFLPWVKGIILIACTIAVFKHIWETFRDTAHRVALTQGQNGNGVSGLGFDADSVFALTNYGISMAALLLFLGVCGVAVTVFMGSAIYVEVSTFITAGLAGGAGNAQYVAILADWLYAVVPVHGMLGLLAAKAGASLTIFIAGMGGHAGMKAALT